MTIDQLSDNLSSKHEHIGLILGSHSHSFFITHTFITCLQSQVVSQARDTITLLDSHGFAKAYNASVFYSAGYDSPYRLVDRHNEVSHGQFALSLYVPIHPPLLGNRCTYK